MKILIVVASRHGATDGIANELAAEFRGHGLVTDVYDARDMPSVSGYDAVVLGSAVYMGNWLPEARRYWEANRAALATLPLWLFSSGPVGADDPKPHGDLEGIKDILEASGAREHKIFAGKLDRHELSLCERIAAKCFHAPEGDFRDWAAVREWAERIAVSRAATPITV
jgi:menaquinone-dependent protoporphyrinogen oxidase